MQAQQGDREAVAQLYRMFADRLYRQILYPCAPDPASAEDLLKDTFLTMLEQIHTFRWDESRGLFPWLAQIGRNRARDRHRRLGTIQRKEGAYQQHVEQLAPRENPEHLLAEEEEKRLLQDRVQAQLQQLNPRYRQAIELRLFRELPREECAQLLGVTVSTFDVVFYRATRAFRKLWDREKEPKNT